MKSGADDWLHKKSRFEPRSRGQCNYNGTVKTALGLIVKSDLGELSIAKPRLVFMDFFSLVFNLNFKRRKSRTDKILGFDRKAALMFY